MNRAIDDGYRYAQPILPAMGLHSDAVACVYCQFTLVYHGTMTRENGILTSTPMIKNRALWNEWETAYIRSQRPDFARNLRIVEALYAEARAFGALDRPDRPDRLAHKIKLARALNVPTAAGTNRG